MSISGSSSHNTEQFDYVIVGGGIAGTVLASRLHEGDTSLSILVIEAGHDQSQHPLVRSPLSAPLLKGSDIDWNYTTVPQQHLDDRIFYASGGKALGGGSVTNYGNWSFIFYFGIERQFHIYRTLVPGIRPFMHATFSYLSLFVPPGEDCQAQLDIHIWTSALYALSYQLLTICS